MARSGDRTDSPRRNQLVDEKPDTVRQPEVHRRTRASAPFDDRDELARGPSRACRAAGSVSPRLVRPTCARRDLPCVPRANAPRRVELGGGGRGGGGRGALPVAGIPAGEGDVAVASTLCRARRTRGPAIVDGGTGHHRHRGRARGGACVGTRGRRGVERADGARRGGHDRTDETGRVVARVHRARAHRGGGTVLQRRRRGGFVAPDRVEEQGRYRDGICVVQPRRRRGLTGLRGSTTAESHVVPRTVRHTGLGATDDRTEARRVRGAARGVSRGWIASRHRGDGEREGVHVGRGRQGAARSRIHP